MPDVAIVLKVAGLELTSFDALTVERAYDQIADSFSFNTQSTSEIRKRIPPKGYTPCEVWIGGQLKIRGRIEKLTPTMSTADLGIEGRSLTGTLVDCSIKGPVQHGNQTLGSLARKLCTPFGVEVVLPQGDSKSLGEKVVSSDGDTPASFLQKLGLAMGWLWQGDLEGRLQLYKPALKGPVVARLVEGQGVFLDCRVTVDGTQLFSEYTVIQDIGWPDPIKGFVEDKTIPIFRPKLRTGSEANFRDIQKAATLDHALSLAAGLSIEVDVGDWTNDAGVVWDPGQFVEVTSPTCYLDNPTVFQIAGVTTKLDNGGRKATLRLAIPGAYTGEAVFPW